MGLGISTKTLKIFRPVPSYFVSSLTFKRSVRRVGSSDCAALCLLDVVRFRPVARGAGAAGGISDARSPTSAGSGIDALGEPELRNPEKRVAINTTATTTNETA